MNTVSGIVRFRLSTVTPCRKAFDRLPIKLLTLITPCAMPVVSNARL